MKLVKMASPRPVGLCTARARPSAPRRSRGPPRALERLDAPLARQALERLLCVAPGDQPEVGGEEPCGRDQQQRVAPAPPLEPPHALPPRFPVLRPPAPPRGEPARELRFEPPVGRPVVLAAPEGVGQELGRASCWERE